MPKTNIDKEAVKFTTPIRNYTIVIDPMVIDGHGHVVNKGKRVEFSGGEYVTDNVKEINYLRNHKYFGIDFFEAKAEVKTTETQVENS